MKKCDKKFKKLIICCVFLLLNNACTQSLESSHSLTISDYQQSFQQFCLGAKGHGRIEFYREKYLFDFQSAILPDIGWRLVLDLPGMGQEWIDISLGEGTSLALQGSFVERLKASKDFSKSRQKLLEEVARRLKFFLHLAQSKSDLKNCQLNENKRLLCTWGQKERGLFFKDSEQLKGVFDLLDNRVMHLSLSEPKDHFYSLAEITLKAVGQSGPESLPFRLKLFANSCQFSPQ